METVATPETGGAPVQSEFKLPDNVTANSVEAAALELKHRRSQPKSETKPEVKAETKSEPDKSVETKPETISEPDKPANTAQQDEPTETADEPADLLDAQADTAQEPAVTPEILAKHFGLPASSFVVDSDGVKIKTKVDGVESTVSLSEAVKNYQLESSVNRRFMEHAEQKKQFEQRQAQVLQAIQAKNQQLDQYLELAQAQLMGEFRGVNWDQLKQTDPVAYNSLRLEYEDRSRALSGALQQRNAERQAQAVQWKQAEEQRLKAESAKLPEIIPEWRDPKVMETEQAELRKFLMETHRFSTEDVAAVSRSTHRAIPIIRDAWQWQKHLRKMKEVKKQVQAAPKMAAPGTQGAKGTSSDKSVRDAQGRFAQSHSLEDAVKLRKLTREKQLRR